MWRLRNEALSNGNGLRFHVKLDTKPMAYINVLTGWQYDEKFRSIFNAWLADTTLSREKKETGVVEHRGRRGLLVACAAG